MPGFPMCFFFILGEFSERRPVHVYLFCRDLWEFSDFFVVSVFIFSMMFSRLF